MATTKKQAVPRYAEGTTVPIEKSHIAVQKLLKQYGASNSADGEEGELLRALRDFCFVEGASSPSGGTLGEEKLSMVL
jgi:hypothetical protein